MSLVSYDTPYPA